MQGIDAGELNENTGASLDVDIHSFGEANWPGVWEIVDSVCRSGGTFTYPTVLSPDQGRTLWTRRAPGRTRVA